MVPFKIQFLYQGDIFVNIKKKKLFTKVCMNARKKLISFIFCEYS